MTTSAQSSQLQAEKAIKDLETYSDILRNMEKKLIDTEESKAKIELDLQNLKQRFMKLINNE